MTEPPQPPNQPPQPPGYGHLPGPPQPGYGYPQQGANPYAQEPRPHPQQPQQPQQPHPQQPPPPYQQGGYGFPAQPPGMPPTVPIAPHPGPPPGGGRRKGPLLIAAAVAGVLVLGSVGYFAFLKDDGSATGTPVAKASTPAAPEPSGSAPVDKGDGKGVGDADTTDLNAGRKAGEDKALWLKTSNLVGPGAGIPTKGQWVVGDTVVKTVDKGFVAYAVTDGKEKWKLDARGEICGVTGQLTSDGKTVVIVKDGDNCNQMKLVDLKAGKEVWTKEVQKEGLFESDIDASVTFTGDTIAVNRMGGTGAYRLATGERLFSGIGPEGCQPASYAAGNGKMIGFATCMDADNIVEIQDADPNTGKKTWSYRLPKGYAVTAVYSVNPIVVDASNRETSQRAILALNNDGTKRSTMSGEGSFQLNCGGSSSSEGLQNCGDAAVDGATLYLSTAAEGGFNNEIVAFDLGSGKVKWRTAAGDKRNYVPVKAANGQLTAYRRGALDQPGEIVSLPAAGGGPKVLLRMPSGSSAKIEGSFNDAYRSYEGGRFFQSTTSLLGNGKDERLLMVFGK
ncbi:PQQ-binding-like beta-propeller repeat protein [Streptomyces sp. NPDC087917]|uniref:outer membrane protein assembly factor BamB family protein n=1 Tax=Streptomyces sp. NPDC087917 TaxID=3155060 RepID=UPI003434F3A1